MERETTKRESSMITWTKCNTAIIINSISNKILMRKSEKQNLYRTVGKHTMHGETTRNMDNARKNKMEPNRLCTHKQRKGK